MTITAHIDISTAKGRQIVRELERYKEIVVIDNPLPVDENGQPIKTYSAKEVLLGRVEPHLGFVYLIHRVTPNCIRGYWLRLFSIQIQPLRGYS
jgi:hypothetical protein